MIFLRLPRSFIIYLYLKVLPNPAKNGKNVASRGRQTATVAALERTEVT